MKSPQTSQANMITETKKIIKGMKEKQRFKKALVHVNDALSFRHPKPYACVQNLPSLFKFCYKVQTSDVWTWVLMLCTYIYILLVFVDPKYYFKQKLAIEVIILTIFWFDIALYVYHKNFKTIQMQQTLQKRFYVKITVLTLLVVDLLIFSVTAAQDIRYFRPFRFIRGLLSALYDARTRKNVLALIYGYKDLAAFTIIYVGIQLTFTLLSTQFFNIPPGTSLDEYRQNYPHFLKNIMITYVWSTTDYYPDNQLKAIRWNQWSYLLVLLFVYLNVFFFVNLPSKLVYNSMVKARTKTIIIDQIRQQHSLILAFITLAGEKDHIDGDTLIKFLIHMYRKKVRYVTIISEISIKLDQNLNGVIQIGQFMHLARILAQNSYMLPPNFDDIQCWISFRRNLNKNFKLKTIAKHQFYQIILNVIIILTFINCIAIIASSIESLYILDKVFYALFIFDIVFRLLAIGPQNFLKVKYAKIDILIVVVMIIISLFPTQMMPKNSEIIIKMLRIFRISTLISIIMKQDQQHNIQEKRNTLLFKIRSIYGITIVILPVFLKLSSLIFTFFYYLGVMGMQFYYYTEAIPPTANYGVYAQFSNFTTFRNSMYVIIQVFIQAGWSMVVFDYAARSEQYLLTYVYFIACHIILVILLVNLFRSVVWEVFYCVLNQFQSKRQIIIEQQRRKTQNKKKISQFAKVKQIVDENGFIIPNTIVKRQFLENKLDIQIFKRLKHHYFQTIKQVKSRLQKRNSIMQQIVISKKNILLENNQQDSVKQDQSINEIYQNIIRQNLKDDQIQLIIDQDVNQKMEQLLQKIVLHPKTKYSETMVYPKALLQILDQKFIQPFKEIQSKTFDMHKNPLASKQSIQFHIYQLNTLLQIGRSARDHKLDIAKQMENSNLITLEEAQKVLSNKINQHNYHIDPNWIIRTMFLSNTNQRMINKFEIQYFSDVYGKSFKEIHQIDIRQMLKYEALLTYSLKNILRYPEMPNNHFFQIFTTIQDRLSNNLLRKGSLIKFVYQIETFSDNWFTVEFKNSQDIKIHFIKTGIWIFNKNMQENQTYYAKDLFNYDLQNKPDRMTYEKILKLLYQTFQSLAYGLSDQSYFFQTNPTEVRYDVYSFYIDVAKVQRLVEKKLQISKIMMVILAKQQDRQNGQALDYQLAEISLQRKHKKVDFNLEDSQNQTFQKFKKFAVLDREKIIQNQSLPFAYILNLMQEVKQTLKIYSPYLVHQVETVLNKQFNNH